ncbi:TniB family NTP-binding protein [Sphingomonas sp. CCH10-B3]|jgi:hypothetical protein|uniref:TniB family NTP-binding protein n=1 Tax=Sphingomonas sp. CCH10-B3 TaxID=1768757 RepID=UPI00083476AF|nr:TniB family NTP-binding protein [Sphingomonas sp. CCH10-B3]
MSLLPPSPFWIGFDEARQAVETIVDIARDGPEERPTCIILVGRSGMGKTSILREAQRRISHEFSGDRAKLAADARHIPMLRVVIPSNPTSIKINLALLWKQGWPITNAIHRTADFKVVDLLREQGTRMVAIDNIHATLTASGRARNDTLNAMRFLMSEGTTPMVLAGLDRAADVFSEDEELAQRSIIVRLNPWEPGASSQRIIRELATGMRLAEPERFAEPRYAEFLYRHSGGITGEFKRLLHFGSKVAANEGRARVEFRDLERAAQRLLRNFAV